MKSQYFTKAIRFVFLFIIIAQISNSQNIAITDDNAYSPDASAMLDIKSTSKGLLIPRLDSAQRVAITTPATGLMVYDTDDNAFFYFDGTNWVNASSKVLNPGISGFNTALFSVVNNNGDTVFAVYPESVIINVGDGLAKGSKGGFAVGGLSSAGKAAATNYFTVSPDSVRIYIDTTTAAKGSKGGFAVGGLSSSGKALGNSYLTISDDSVRIYVEEDPAKGSRGGFAVGGLSSAGKATSTDFMKMDPLNYFIGHEAGGVNTTGEYNSFFGYKSGIANTTGNNNNFIGYRSGWANVSGNNNSFNGYEAGFLNTSGNYNVFSGYKSGWSNTVGSKNIFLGYQCGFSNLNGEKNVFLGYQSGFFTIGGAGTWDGDFNTFIGYQTGYSNTSGQKNVFMGYLTGYSNQTGIINTFLGSNAGYSNLTGSNNVFLGANAGYNELGSNKLYIHNSIADSANALIYGEFDNNLLRFNGDVVIKSSLQIEGGSPSVGNILISDASGNTSWGETNIISDADGDTKVNVEESADEDIIHFDTGNYEAMNISSSDINMNTNVKISKFFTLQSTTGTFSSGNTLTPSKSYHKVNGSSISGQSIYIADGSSIGQVLIIEGVSDSNTISLYTSNLQLSGSITLGSYDSLMLVWNGSYWVEISRSNN